MKIQPAISTQFNDIIDVWESSVRATHLFLTEATIQELKIAILEKYLPQLTIFVVVDHNNKINGFIGIAENRLEMLFVSQENRSKGLGKQMLNFAIQQLGVNELDVNEQNPQAVGFYQYMGFKQFARSEIDGQGNPFPLLHMRLETTK